MSESEVTSRSARKPSGAVMYTQSQGANVWPGQASSDKSLVRSMDGELVVFREFRGDDSVVASVSGRDIVLTQAEWQSLPIDKS